MSELLETVVLDGVESTVTVVVAVLLSLLLLLASAAGSLPIPIPRPSTLPSSALPPLNHHLLSKAAADTDAEAVAKSVMTISRRIEEDSSLSAHLFLL